MSTYPPPAHSLDPALVTSALEIPGYRIVRNVGVVRGIVVRSRNLFGTIGAGLQTLVGGSTPGRADILQASRRRSRPWPVIPRRLHGTPRPGQAPRCQPGLMRRALARTWAVEPRPAG